MKHIIFTLIALFSCSAFAEMSCHEDVSQKQTQSQVDANTATPAWLKGATITITKADGSVSTVSADKFMVVPRAHKRPVTNVTTAMTKSCMGINRHRLGVLAGQGPKGGLRTDRSGAPGEVTVESKVGVIGGGQYQYLTPLLDNRLFLGVQGQTNDSVLGNIGIEF